MAIDRALITRRLTATAIFAWINVVITRGVQFAADLGFLEVFLPCLACTAAVAIVASLLIIIGRRFRPRAAELLDDTMMRIYGWVVSIVITIGIVMMIVRIALRIAASGGA